MIVNSHFVKFWPKTGGGAWFLTSTFFCLSANFQFHLFISDGPTVSEQKYVSVRILFRKDQ